MSETFLWGFIAVGCVAILGLLIYIKTLMANLRKLKAEQERLQQQAESKQKALQLDVVESLKVILSVLLDDQVDLSEGCIRIKVLLDNYDISLHEDERFKIFSVMAAELAHMPTHDARKQVDKKILRKLDEQRFKLEATHRDEIREAAKALRTWLERPLQGVS